MNIAIAPDEPLAAIDMGSNSFRVEIGQLQHGRYRKLDYLKETVRLGAGLDANGLLSEEAMQRGLACLRSFAVRLAQFAPRQVRAVATQTLREARNRDSFLLRAQEALGFPIEVISGREEARLIYVGVAHLQPSSQPRLVVDIGGRSTELILGQGQVSQEAESFRTGCVSLSMRHFPEGRLTAAAFRAAQVAAGAELEEGLQTFAPQRWRMALGASGTVGAVSQILAAAGLTDGRITPAGLRWCIEQCIAAGHMDALDLPGMKADRRAVLAGGLCILYTLMMHFGIDTLWPAKGALRQGVVIDLYQRRLAAMQPANRRGTDRRGGDRRHTDRRGPLALLPASADRREQTVFELQRRFLVDDEQATRVGQAALALFDRALPDADGDTRRELAWAAAWHELGLMVSHHDHHRHSAYLLAHVDAPGFSQSQQRRIGDLVLAQRGGLRKVEPQMASETFAWQVLCLRLAVILCHAREPVPLPPFGLAPVGREARLMYPPGWADAHPRTQYLLREEALAWSRSGPLRLVLPDSA